MINTGTWAQWVAIAGTVIGGGVWVGGIDQQVDGTADMAKSLASTPVQIATLTERLQNVQRDIGELKQQQTEILIEIRRLSDKPEPSRGH